MRNRRPTKSANVVVQVEFDAADGFVLAGLRSGRVPVLLPGAEEELRWNMVPVECGLVRVPRIRVVDRRVGSGEGEEGEEGGWEHYGRKRGLGDALGVGKVGGRGRARK